MIAVCNVQMGLKHCNDCKQNTATLHDTRTHFDKILEETSDKSSHDVSKV